MSEPSLPALLPLYCRADHANDATAIAVADVNDRQYHPDDNESRKPILVMIPGYPEDIAKAHPNFRGYLSPSDETVGALVKKNLLGHMKCAEALLGNSVQNAHIFSMLYSKVPNLNQAGLYFSGQKEKLHGDDGPDDEQLFVNQVLLPIAGITQNNKLDVDHVCQKLSRLTIVAHSLGCGFAQKVAERFRRTLSDYGYNDNEVNRIVREPIVVALANGVPLNPENNQQPGFRTVGFSGSYDRRIAQGLKQLNNNTWCEAYEAAGYDQAILQARESAIHDGPYSPDPQSARLKMKSSVNGVTFFGDLPSHLEWREAQSDGTALDRNLQHSIAPEHNLQMFSQRHIAATDENPLNQVMVRRVQTALGNLIKRGVSKAHNQVQLNNNGSLQEPFRRELYTMVADLNISRERSAA